MKRLLTTIVLGAVVVVTAAAQSWQDALFLSENSYFGTARGVGMGNALTAVGGDPGSLGFNPAGSAVASYSQVVFTPGITFSSVGAQGLIAPGESAAIGLGDKVNASYARVKVPNVGFIISMDTGYRTGFKRHALGVVLNTTSDYTFRMNSSGVNQDNSYAAALASSAEGYTEAQLGSSSWWEDGPLWADMVGYRSGMFSSVPGSDNVYQAVTEVRDADGHIWLADPIDQQFGEQRYGSKTDIVLNYAADVNDKLYFGFNLGLTTLNYNMSEYWQESPRNAAAFPDIEYTDGTLGRFESLLMKRQVAYRGTGYYFKGGVLWRPVAGLRLGFAAQTPTFMTLVSRQQFSGEVSLTGKSFAPSTSPVDEWSYGMRQPYRLNLGVAYSFGSVLLLSADYELAGYRSIRYSSSSSFSDVSYWANENADIQDVLGVGHMARLGVEVKPLPALSLRAGYNLSSGAQRNYLEAEYGPDGAPTGKLLITPLTSEQKWALCKHSASLGAGFQAGPFFADAAVRLRFLPSESVVPYFYYTYGGDYSYQAKYPSLDVLTPEVGYRTILTDVLVTLGWRF